MNAAPILEVAQRLGARLKRVTAVEWAGPCPRCGGRDRFSVNTARGVWNCRRCDAGGDAIALARHLTGMSYAEALAFVGDERASEPALRRPHDSRQRPIAPNPSEVADNAKMLASAARYVREMGPIIEAPEAKAYLRNGRERGGRGIDTDPIADVLSRTDAIGWHPAVMFRQDGHELDGQRLGAIIAVMTDPKTARPTGAISRTYVVNGRKIGKAKTLGQPQGIVRLSRDDDVTHGLFICEGLETALDAMARGLRPMWSTGSTSIMAAFPPLAGIECLTVLADNDPSGAGERAARAVEGAWVAAGAEVRIFMAAERGDLNDMTRKA